jgi:hypothetical protein
MSQTLQNQILLAKSMNGIVSLSDGAGSTIENGQIVTNGLSSDTFAVESLSTFNGELKINSNNNIVAPNGQLVSLYCIGSSYFTEAMYSETVPVTTLSVTNKLYVDTAVVNALIGYAKLADANTWSQLQTFSNGVNISNAITLNNNTITGTGNWASNQNFNGNVTIPINQNTAYLLPYGRDTGTLRIGTNLQNNTGGTNNYCWGLNTMQATYSPLGTTFANNASNNVAIGIAAGQRLTSGISGTIFSCDNNVMIGHNSLQAAFFQSYRNVCIGNNCAKTGNVHSDNVYIGYDCCNGGTLGNYSCVVIGSGAMKNLSGMSAATVCGYNSGSNLSGNSITIFGANNCTAAINNNRGVVCGTSSGNNINSNNGIIIIGSEAGNNFIGSSTVAAGYNTFIGQGSDTTLQTCFNSIALGYFSQIQNDFELVLGGYSSLLLKSGYPKVCIPSKNYIYCNQSIATNSTLAFRSAENVLVTVNTVTAITLPTPSGNSYDNAGAKFNIMKTFSGTNTLTISAGASQTIMWQGTAAATFVMDTTVSFATFVCVSATTTGTTWEVTSSDKLNIKSPLSINSISGFTRILSDGADNLITGLTNATTIGIGNSSISLLGTTNTNNTVAVGSNSLTNATISQQNTAIGAFSMAGFNSTTNTTHANSALGAYSAQNLSNGINNTFLGAYTGFTSATQYNNSTAVGYSASITASNQIMLGTATETVVVPSTQIRYGTNYFPNKTFFSITSNTDWAASPPSAGFCKYVSFSATGVSAITLTLPAISGLFEGMEFIFRRTSYVGAGSSSTSTLTAITTGSDLIFQRNDFTTNTSTVILASGEYQAKIVLLSKSNQQWAYFSA